MPNVQWIFERGVFDHGTPERMLKIVEELGMEGIEVVFSEGSEHFKGILDVKKQKELPFDKNAAVIMFGSFSMARYLLRNYSWVPGVWFDTEALSCHGYYSHWGQFLLQNPYAMMPLIEAKRQKNWLNETFGRDRSIFLRPDSQLKQFAGQVVKIDEFDKFYSEAMIYGEPQTMTLIASPRVIKNEWRLVIGDRKVISGSGYIRSSEVEITDGYPDAVKDLAETIANSTEWQPHPIFCIDICETDQGLNLLEIGSINTCGLYNCYLKPIIEKSAEIALREWKDTYED